MNEASFIVLEFQLLSLMSWDFPYVLTPDDPKLEEWKFLLESATPKIDG